VWLTFVFEEDTALCDNDRHVSIDEAVTLVISQGDCDVCITNALRQWHAKYSGRFSCRDCQLGSEFANLAVVPFSSDLSVVFLLNFLHHDASSRFDGGDGAGAVDGWIGAGAPRCDG
jgi:hypothetical protein